MVIGRKCERDVYKCDRNSGICVLPHKELFKFEMGGIKRGIR